MPNDAEGLKEQSQCYHQINTWTSLELSGKPECRKEQTPHCEAQRWVCDVMELFYFQTLWETCYNAWHHKLHHVGASCQDARSQSCGSSRIFPNQHKNSSGSTEEKTCIHEGRGNMSYFFFV